MRTRVLTTAHHRMLLAKRKARRIAQRQFAILEALEQDDDRQQVADWSDDEDRPLQRHLMAQAPGVARKF